MLESAKICDANLKSHCYYPKKNTFKNVYKTLTLKTPISCNSFTVINVLICSAFLQEYIGETGVGKTRLRDSVRVYRQHIKQPEHQKLKVIRICGRRSFKIFPSLQMQSNDTIQKSEWNKVSKRI